jgi:hypothetical protein
LKTEALALALVLAATPAEACHRFRVWNYPQPQRCFTAYARAFAVAPPRVPIFPPRAPDLVLPDLIFVPIEDADEFLRARLLLRVLMEGQPR